MTLTPASTASDSWSDRLRRGAAWSAFVILGSAGAWFVWMGWDQDYWIDSRTGMAHGPYRAWQVIGCGITLVAIAVWTSRGRCWPSVLLLPPAFTLAWSVTASSEDSSGLWLVGALLVAAGSTLGTLIVLGVTRLARPEHALPKSPFDGDPGVSRVD